MNLMFPLPDYVSIDLIVTVCASSSAFQGDVEAAVISALGTSVLPNGSTGFFYFDNFTFGTPLERSALEAAIQSAYGVAGVLSIQYRERGFTSSWTDLPDTLTSIRTRYFAWTMTRTIPKPVRFRSLSKEANERFILYLLWRDLHAGHFSRTLPLRNVRVSADYFQSRGKNDIAYRFGDYLSVRYALLLARPGEVELTNWQPGAQGDLAVQMIEWWAYLADILSFYNERIANESYLLTAILPESVQRSDPHSGIPAAAGNRRDRNIGRRHDVEADPSPCRSVFRSKASLGRASSRRYSS